MTSKASDQLSLVSSSPEEGMASPHGVGMVVKPPADAEEDGGHDFDWLSDSNDIVLREQPATAIYRNPYGFIVIRQQNRDRGNFDDDVVLVDPAHAELLILALQQTAGLD